MLQYQRQDTGEFPIQGNNGGFKQQKKRLPIKNFKTDQTYESDNGIAESFKDQTFGKKGASIPHVLVKLNDVRYDLQSRNNVVEKNFTTPQKLHNRKLSKFNIKTPVVLAKD